MSDKNTKKEQEECSCYAESRHKKACPPIRNVSHPLRYYEFTQDEIRALEECDRESFYRRCLPFSAVLASLTYAAINSGRLRPNPRFGALPKVTLAVVAGYFIGKLSYQQACAEKLMALPGSYIGQLLRDRRDGKVGSDISGRRSPAAKSSSMLGAGPGDIYSDAGPGSALDLDTDRPLFDDSYRPPPTDPSVSSGSGGAAPAAAAGGAPLSYDELRRRNRGHHADARQEPYRLEPSAPAPPPPARARPAPPPPAHTNKYGDVVE